MRRHLIIQLARFGDLIQTGRLVRSLQAEPEDAGSQVHLCLDRSLAALARPVYPDVIVHEVQAHAGGDAAGRGVADRRIFQELASLDFDAVYNLNFSGLSFALAGLFDPECVRGYRLDRGQPLRDTWLALAMRWSRRRATSPLNLVDLWAALAPNPVIPGEVNPVAQRRGGGLGVVLAGRHARRSLPMETLAACVAAVFQAEARDRAEPKVFLLGGPGERPQARALRQVAPRGLVSRLEDLTGRTDWAGLVEVVSGLDVLLTPDTGTMHLAAALGVPVQAFFLASAWAFETGPYGLGHRVWQAVTPCSPCLESAACDCELECRTPFASKPFLSFLSGRFNPEWPPGLLGLVSGVDELGAVYRPVFGEDPWARRRESLRAVVAEWLGLGRLGPCPEAEAADELFLERDWMLPDATRWRESGAVVCGDWI